MDAVLTIVEKGRYSLESFEKLSSLSSLNPSDEQVQAVLLNFKANENPEIFEQEAANLMLRNDSGVVHYVLGLHYWKRGERNKAIEAFRNASYRNPEYTFYYEDAQKVLDTKSVNYGIGFSLDIADGRQR